MPEKIRPDESKITVHESAETLDRLVKLALLKVLEPKPSPKDDGSWLGIPKALFLSGLGTVAFALFNWFLSIQTETNKLSNELIKQAVTAEDQEQAARNLRFLSRLKLISVEESQLDAVLEDPKSRPLFTSSEGGPTYRVSESGMVEFEGDWVEKNIVTAKIPQLVGVKTLFTDEEFDGTVRLNRIAMPATIAAFTEIETAGLKDRIVSFEGGFFPREIRGARGRLSAHALGMAFDMNCPWNMLGKPPAEKGQEGSLKELVPIFEKYGFKWGGTFPRPDGCHFEYSPQAPKEQAKP
jgi:hypothetical protein